VKVQYKLYDENVIAVGMAGMGKSQLIHDLLPMLKGADAIVWDPVWQHQWPGFEEFMTMKLAATLKRGVYRPAMGNRQEFDELCAILMARGNVVLVVDEAAPVLDRPLPNAERLIRMGRNFGVTYVVTTQMPSDLAPIVVTNAHHKITFRLERPEDIGYMSKWMNLPREAIQSLKKFEKFWKQRDEQPVKLGP